MQVRNTLFFCLIFISLFLKAQPPKPDYPHAYFRNPLGIPMQLSANFGELRSNHWHMGLDIRTQQRENLPVYAAADGYVAHIGIRPGSFGQFIVINHPNGMSTLYAHLNAFFPELQQYITDAQYSKESWSIELDFTPDRFPVQKGKWIASSGNTGGSMGPHLHFEIFDTRTTKRFNPLLFGLPLEDEVPPVIVRLAVYDRTKSLYEQNPELYTLKKSGADYIISGNSILRPPSGQVSFAVQTYDKMNGGGSQNGVYAAELVWDNNPQVLFVLDSIDYDETAYINAHIDYKHDYEGGVYLQHLSRLPGDNGPVYKLLQGDGVISITDTGMHQGIISVQDAQGNTSRVVFDMQAGEIPALPDAGSAIKKVVPNSRYLLGKPGFEIQFSEGNTYDTFSQQYAVKSILAGEAVSYAHTVNDASIPIHRRVTVRIRPDKAIPESLWSKVVMQRSDKSTDVRKVTWENGWMVSTFGDLGTFQAFADQTPPSINDPGKGDTINLSASSRILFTPRDNFGIITRFRAEIDGKWICFTNDKGKNWIYKFDERCPYGVHELKVEVEDLVGNTTTRTWWFRREPYTPKPKAPAKKKSKSVKKH